MFEFSPLPPQRTNKVKRLVAAHILHTGTKNVQGLRKKNKNKVNSTVFIAMGVEIIVKNRKGDSL